jgi:integrase
MAGSPRGSSKEVALLSAVLSYGQRIGAVESNACHGVTLEKAAPRSRRVMWEEIELVTAQGRKQGGSAHIVALALRAAWLAFKRPSEVLAITTASITEAGLVFQDAKRRKSQGQRTTTIYWTPELRATVDEAVGLRRWAKFGGDRLIFGNMEGHAYSRSGWGTMLARLMQACAQEAAAAGQPFTPFALRDCRPGGITEKMQNQEQDVFEGTGHADRRMIDQVYDRRRARGATAAR